MMIFLLLDGMVLTLLALVQPDPVADLTLRLRHPVRWSLLHPVQAARRLRRH